MKVLMGKQKYTLILIVILAITIGTGVVYAADVIIDGFSNITHVNLVTITAQGDLPIENCIVASPTNTVGGRRKLCQRVTVGDDDASANWRVSASAANQYVSLALDPSVRALAVVIWDGQNNTNFTVNPTGLAGVDLVDATNDGIALRVVFSDNIPMDLTMRVHTDGSNWAEQTVTFNSAVTTGQVVDLFFPFADFGGGAGTVDFENVGAVELEVDATDVASAGADVNMRLVRATSIYEYGDLPTDFSIAIRDANHIPQGLRLGSNLDAESAHQPNSSASGDDTASTPDDEDGVIRSDSNWNDGTGDVTVTVNGCSGTCYLNGWIEFGDGTTSTPDYDFADANEYIIQDFAVTTNGPQNTSSFTIPGYADLTNNSVYARFRVCPTIDTCDTPTAVDVTNGEIEDYQWGFGPTAITLQNATAESLQNDMIWVVALVLVAFGVTGIILYKRQRVTNN